MQKLRNALFWEMKFLVFLAIIVFSLATPSNGDSQVEPAQYKQQHNNKHNPAPKRTAVNGGGKKLAHLHGEILT